MSLPKIPGYSFNPNLGRNNHPRTQILDQIGNTKYTFHDYKINKSNDNKCRNSYLPNDIHCQSGPSWIVYDKKVLCFNGYWLEELSDSPNERFRSRDCQVYYYIEDDTIQVVEPRMRNSKLMQGTVVNRRRVLKQPAENLCYYNLDDMDIGAVLCLGGRSIKLTDCDKFTENILRRLGRELKYPNKRPDKSQVEHMKRELSQKKPKDPNSHQDRLAKFLNYNKHILKFYCFWNNEDTVNDPRSMTLLYFLEDDTVEIQENLPRNCGRTFRLFLKRQKLPKYPNQLKSGLSSVPSQLSDPGYLNVIRGANNQRSTDGNKIRDSLTSQTTASIPCYKDEDLTIGQYVNVYGRLFLICDCDEFTKEFYQVKYGIKQSNSIDMHQYFDTGVSIDRFIPPHNGWGSEEDSLLNCVNPVNPQEIPSDYRAFLSTKRSIDNLLKLTFLARIILDPRKYACFDSHARYEAERLFIISYGMDDNYIYIKEMTLEKKGSLFDQFLIRGRIHKPRDQWENEHVPEYYTEKDLFIGAIIMVKGLRLRLLLCDLYTLNYMEKNAHNFPLSSITVILSKLHEPLQSHMSELEQFLLELDSSNSGYIDYQQFMRLNSLFLSDHITIHEAVTLARHFTDRTSQKSTDPIHNGAYQSPDAKKARIRKHLRIVDYSDYYFLKETWFRYNNPAGCELLTRESAKTLLKGLKFPLPDKLLDDLLDLSTKPDSADLIDLCTLLDTIEWQKLHSDYWNRIGRYLDCDKSLTIKQRLIDAEGNLGKTFNIGQIKWKDLLNSILNHSITSSSKKIHSKYNKEDIDIIV